jgi:hypothetical protein
MSQLPLQQTGCKPAEQVRTRTAEQKLPAALHQAERRMAGSHRRALLAGVERMPDGQVEVAKARAPRMPPTAAPERRRSDTVTKKLSL